jgi:hypothetical protein
MHSIDLRNLSISEAEDLLLEVWLALEKHQVATPKVITIRQANRLEIALTFESEAERATVATELQMHGHLKQTGVGEATVTG